MRHLRAVTDAPTQPAARTSAPAGPVAAPGPVPADWARMALLTCLWGSAFATIEVALETLSPLVIVMLRMWLGAAFLLTVAAIVRAPLPRLLPRPDPAWKWLAAVGLVGNTIPFFLIPWAQQTVNSGMTGIVISSAPLFVAVLAHFLAGERITRRRSAGLAVAFLGVIVLFAPTLSAEAGPGYAMAVGALLLTAVLYAFTVILARFSTHKSLIGGAAGVCLVAAIATTPLGLWDATTNGLEFSARSGAAILALGAGPTALATITYLALARSAGPGFLSLTNYLVPVFAVTLGAVALNETFGWNALAALGLILLGLLLAGRRPKLRA